MKILNLIFAISVVLNASEYYAKIEPLQTYNIKSAVNGKVVYVNDKLEGQSTNSDIIVKLDSKIDKADLKYTKSKIQTLNKIITIEKKTFSKFKKIRSKSQLDKDNQNIKILNIQNQLNDLIFKQTTLEDRLNNKVQSVKNKYISAISVKVGDWVNAGTLLFTTNDLSKAKLTIYVPIDSANEYTPKDIYLNGIKTQYKISKLFKVADAKHLSSYKCEIIINAPKSFSKLMKIEFK